MKLKFIGWQETTNQCKFRGVSLWNDEEGNTLSRRSAKKRYPEAEWTAYCLLTHCPECGFRVVTEIPEGFGHSADMPRAWIFDVERKYYFDLANSMIEKIGKLPFLEEEDVKKLDLLHKNLRMARGEMTKKEPKGKQESAENRVKNRDVLDLRYREDDATITTA
jgi:hypothetical protein